MPVDDHGRAAIFGSPVVTHGESVIVRLPRCLAVKSKIAYLARSTPLHFLLHARVCEPQASRRRTRSGYPCGLKPTSDQIASLRVQRHETLPEWNYTIKPQL